MNKEHTGVASLSDKERVRMMLGDFELDNSTAWSLIKSKLGRTLNHNELIHLSNLFEKIYNIKPNRFEKRNKFLLVKLFEKNIDKFKDFIDRIAYRDEVGHLGGPRASELQVITH